MDTFISILLTLVVLALVIVILELVQQRSTSVSHEDSEEAVQQLLVRAERRIDRLMADARSAMFDEVLHPTDQDTERPPSGVRDPRR